MGFTQTLIDLMLGKMIDVLIVSPIIFLVGKALKQLKV